ncbi:putative bifunctional diguanylate cyclase/phosphodiesterase [Paraglaciecola sp.]|uniref:putative bifunctional diguanylate cyclase/phosphodiesterase n=1 Tax=Paraglaciecola sp. TaxID=1920173 RepID=UPI003EF490F1
MSPILRNWIIFSLLLFSVVSVVAHRMGAFALKLDLTSPQNHTAIYAAASENIQHDIKITENEITLKCNVLHNLEDNYCALTILLSKAGEFPEIAQGVDLSIYKELELDVDYSAPIGSPNVRVSFKNYNPAYSREGNYESFKFNSIAFEPQYNNSLAALPLSSFNVEQWWIDRFDLSASLKDIEFSNVSYIEILPNEISKISDYEIVLQKFIMVGELFSEASLLIAILCLWLILIVGLVVQNTRHLKFLAITDVLTGCYNRRGITQWAENKLSNMYSNGSISIFYFDLDDFKKVNDGHGHNIGDQLLCQFTKRVLASLKHYKNTEIRYRVARLAGDEFAIVLINLPNKDLDKLASILMEMLTRPISFKSCTIKTSVSLGICHTQIQSVDFQELVDKADMAMYFAKKHGKNQFKIFDDSIAENIYFRKKTSEKIKAAVENDDFHLNFMPIYECSSLHIKRVEVLIRCKADSLKGIGPDIYIPIAEEFNLIHEIDMWVIENTFKTIDINKTMVGIEPIIFCINISAVELHHNKFVNKLSSLLEKYSIKAQNIELEITETSLVDANEQSIGMLQEIRNLGVKLALDDFGTGYTAFNQLVHYPVNCLKIDKSFIDNLSADNETQMIMLDAILSIAKAYKLETVAEGIETAEQLAFMQTHGCTYAQGYYLAKPANLETLLTLLAKQTL